MAVLLDDFEKANDILDGKNSSAVKFGSIRYYDDYDKLIILCDSLTDAKGFCLLEKRFVDTTRRYGIFPFTVDRWNNTFEFKEYFEKMMGHSVYDILPNVKETTFETLPLWTQKK